MRCRILRYCLFPTRRDGKSLGEMAKEELGSFAGIVVMLGALGVMIIILAVLVLVVSKR